MLVVCHKYVTLYAAYSSSDRCRICIGIGCVLVMEL